MTELIVALSGNTVELHGTALLEVTARTAEGHVVTPPTDSLVFTSSDYGIALVSPQGVVYGGSRGTATIRVIYGGVSAGLTVLVRARLAVTLGEATRTTNFVVAVGDARCRWWRGSSTSTGCLSWGSPPSSGRPTTPPR